MLHLNKTIIKLASILVVFILVSGQHSTASAADAQATLYERLGGWDAISAAGK